MGNGSSAERAGATSYRGDRRGAPVAAPVGRMGAGPPVAPADSLVAERERGAMVRRTGENLVLGEAGVAWWRR